MLGERAKHHILVDRRGPCLRRSPWLSEDAAGDNLSRSCREILLNAGRQEGLGVGCACRSMIVTQQIDDMKRSC